jgi:hypothetical protein
MSGSVFWPEARPAPTIGGVLADPSQLAACSTPYFYTVGDVMDSDYTPVQPTLVETTDAEALLDLRRFATEIGGAIEVRTGNRLLSPYSSTTAEDLVDETRIISRNTLTSAADIIAGAWEHAIQQSRRGELLVGVERRGSPLLMYRLVMDALARRRPDLTAAIVPFDLGRLAQSSTRRSRDRVREGVELVDDCLITGRQQRNWSNSLIRQGVHPEKISSHYASVAEERAATTIVPGVPEPQGVFTHPTFEPGRPSVTTTVSSSDFGFRHLIGTAYETAGVSIRTDKPDVAHPSLLSPVREYNLPKGIKDITLPAELQARINAVEAVRQLPWLDLSAL